MACIWSTSTFYRISVCFYLLNSSVVNDTTFPPHNDQTLEDIQIVHLKPIHNNHSSESLLSGVTIVSPSPSNITALDDNEQPVVTPSPHEDQGRPEEEEPIAVPTAPVSPSPHEKEPVAVPTAPVSPSPHEEEPAVTTAPVSPSPHEDQEREQPVGTDNTHTPSPGKSSEILDAFQNDPSFRGSPSPWSKKSMETAHMTGRPDRLHFLWLLLLFPIMLIVRFLQRKYLSKGGRVVDACMVRGVDHTSKNASSTTEEEETAVSNETTHTTAHTPTPTGHTMAAGADEPTALQHAPPTAHPALHRLPPLPHGDPPLSDDDEDATTPRVPPRSVNIVRTSVVVQRAVRRMRQHAASTPVEQQQQHGVVTTNTTTNATTNATTISLPKNPSKARDGSTHDEARDKEKHEG
jgi:hypothetical protein